MTPPPTPPPVRHFGSDETVHWSCRAGEVVLWVGTDSFLASDKASARTLRNFWEMRDGDYVTITNRWVDLSVWFEPHPSEVAGHAALEMVKRFNTDCWPKERMEGKNIWRVKAGDRLVWVTTADAQHPVREILDLRACAVAAGESTNFSEERFLEFGAPHSDEQPPRYAAAARTDFHAAVALGVPREFAPEWRFGA